MKNILILNAGTRNRLIKDFIKTVKGKCKVIVTDNYELAPALYEGDKCYITKRWNEDGYWDDILEICRKDNVGLVLSLIDPELEELAFRKEEFEKEGIMVNSASYDVVHSCFDKLDTMNFIMDEKLPFIKTENLDEFWFKKNRKEETQFPVFIKPRFGSGSLNVRKIENYEELISIDYKDNKMIIQEFMSGQEIGVDIYVDLITHELVSIFAKKKLKMRAGETDKSVSFKDEKLFKLICEYVSKRKLLGVNDIDVFCKNGEYYISEVNPRFGGGYIHAYECGVDFPEMLLKNMNGEINEKQIGRYDENIYMMKYFDIYMKK